jgi:hypothetical protein
MRATVWVSIGLGCTLVSCGGARRAEVPATWNATLDPSQRVAVVENLAGPEAVRYDSEQDLYFV